MLGLCWDSLGIRLRPLAESWWGHAGVLLGVHWEEERRLLLQDTCLLEETAFHLLSHHPPLQTAQAEVERIHQGGMHEEGKEHAVLVCPFCLCLSRFEEEAAEGWEPIFRMIVSTVASPPVCKWV